VHETSFEGDLLLMLVRDLMESSPTLRVILMTATPHLEIFLSYLSGICRQGLQPLLVRSIQPFKREVKYADDLGFPLRHSKLLEGSR
jgi:hypothetical protein